MRRLFAAVLLVVALAGCAAEPDPPPPAFNATDVMFLQMSLDYIGQGDQVVALAERRAGDPRVRALAIELRGQWQGESATMRRWLTGWQQPPSADPAAGAHAGHGELHSLRPSDLAELEAAKGTDFDRTAVSLLLGHLHNCVELTRMEATGGQYPPAKALAETMTRQRQGQIQRMLALAA
ncbi:DUF305 domain-containing protein [Amorphoplanes digitatis]|uniref:Uncharacterized protein (DUF305 family) n=1 Tax=Actinoplanes digitatis TaxID=1868 RepID=A0A7W7MQC2_9ACTN|nr:DUF305 domain-containing protein [Actinoplanes digitatis]MBB4762425.1 uncharacterized protein (DUF305 family) [Actinoplanes digitatis]GID92451.1 DUF305 domain-containing protein [Actinoplanes digitatis]